MDTNGQIRRRSFFEQLGVSLKTAKLLIDCEVNAVKEAIGYGDCVVPLIRSINRTLAKTKKWHGMVPPVTVERNAKGELVYRGSTGVSIRSSLEEALVQAEGLKARQDSLLEGRQRGNWLKVKLRQDIAVVVCDQVVRDLGKSPRYFWGMGMVLYTGFGRFLDLTEIADDPQQLRALHPSDVARYKTRLADARLDFKNDRTRLLSRILGGENRDWWEG